MLPSTCFKITDGSFSEAPSALKISWPMKRRTPENEIVDHLRQVLPSSALVHLPDIFFSSTLTPQQLNIPWTKMNLTLTEENHQDRVLRALASPLYKKLWEAGSVKEFKKVWLNCLESHHLAYTKGKVFHQDISENNLMVFERPDGAVAGILNDWDMAHSVNLTLGGVTVGHHPTGTPSFMAIGFNKRKRQGSLSSPGSRIFLLHLDMGRVQPQDETVHETLCSPQDGCILGPI
ncbi:hypothetical protein DFP72DRAFT_126592 [Ephemerocybe angulata]|uniref:Fungal-type protein kinase domain-containing protein n=1 Tax=Ephemerocybe angulata TaxID=980116 RepID=A0A8H6HAL6_9AGAR|nr:hypothetical protein DFP72DRAFT_126592 [Tulosesus angulatus]